jgi:hypothetical protein
LDKQLLKREEGMLDVLGRYDAALTIESGTWSIKAPQLGYTWTVLLLEIAVVLTIYLIEPPV